MGGSLHFMRTGVEIRFWALFFRLLGVPQSAHSCTFSFCGSPASESDTRAEAVRHFDFFHLPSHDAGQLGSADRPPGAQAFAPRDDSRWIRAPPRAFTRDTRAPVPLRTLAFAHSGARVSGARFQGASARASASLLAPHRGRSARRFRDDGGEARGRCGGGGVPSRRGRGRRRPGRRGEAPEETNEDVRGRRRGAPLPPPSIARARPPSHAAPARPGGGSPPPPPTERVPIFLRPRPRRAPSPRLVSSSSVVALAGAIPP